MPVALMAPLSPMKQAPPSTVSPAPKKNPFFIFFGLGLLMVAGAAWIWFKRAKAWDSRMNPVLQALIRCREFPNLKNRIRHRVRFFCSVVTDGSSEGSTRASRVVFGALAKDRRRAEIDAVFGEGVENHLRGRRCSPNNSNPHQNPSNKLRSPRF